MDHRVKPGDDDVRLLRVIQYSRDGCDGIEKPRRTGYPACAGYDDLFAIAPHLPQYGGFFLARCSFAASIHQARSSAKRGNACASAFPPSPTGWPSADNVCAIGPTAIVLEITTMPISESVPCQAVAARAPEKRPAE